MAGGFAPDLLGARQVLIVLSVAAPINGRFALWILTQRFITFLRLPDLWTSSVVCWRNRILFTTFRCYFSRVTSKEPDPKEQLCLYLNYYPQLSVERNLQVLVAFYALFF